jgi:hypothetical protein
VLNRYFATGALIAITSSGALLVAQSPAEPTPSQTTPSPAASRAAPASAQTAEKTATTTLTGCVYREKDIPGRAPNVAERVGIGEDYIFAEMPSSPIASRTPSSASGAPAPVGTTGTASAMYKLHHIDSDQVKPLVGRRVEVVGQIETKPGDQAAPAPGQQSSTLDKVVGHDEVNLAEIAVSSIREVAGTCPATPAPRP